tara:strand:- start:111 stop:287 length:177 start_codon:yes stop_codon:yes gene_type:complete
MNRNEQEYYSNIGRIADALEKLVKIHGESMKVSVYDNNGSWKGNKENGWYEKEIDTKD